MGDRRPEDGGFNRSAAPQRPRLCSQFLRNCANWVWLAVNRVSPVFGLIVTKYRSLPDDGCRAASIAEWPGLSIGPGGSPANL